MKHKIWGLSAFFICCWLIIVAHHHPPSRRKIKQIWHGRVFWEQEPNTTMLRSAPIQINEKQLDDGASRQKNEENIVSQIPRTSTNKNAKKNTDADTDADAVLGTVINASVPTVNKIDIELAVLVLSARDFKDRRNVIRETWGNGHSNVFFIVGKHCPYRPDQRKPWVCEPKNANAIIDEHYNTQQESLTVQLSREPNVIVVDMIDVYRHLATKLHLGYRWVIENTSAKYVLKMDDDSFARVDSVQHWLMNRVNPPKYEIIAGRFGVGVGVVRGGKWAEKKYKPNKYPPWPTGAGHIVSRPVIEYLYLNVDTWVSYQGEDTSIGIWMEKVRSQMDVHRTSSGHFITHSGDCHNKNKFVIGHKISIKKMRECYTTLDEYDHITKNIKSENDLKKEYVDKSVDKHGTIHLKVTANEPDDNIKSQNNWKKKIDIVIPSSLGSAPSKEIERSRMDDHSMYWQLISMSKNAPWIRKIFILVNGNIECPYDLPSNIDIVMVNRCEYMTHCPTKNGFSVATMIHKIPELSEHFIFAEDDIIFGRPVVPDDFFTAEGKPFAWRSGPTWSDGIWGSHHRLYIKPEVFTGKTPTSASPMPHFMYPMLKSYAGELAETYKDWYAFVESHKEGRFSSESNSINDKRNSQEEDLQGVWDSNLITSGRGVYKNINKKRGSLWDEVSISKAGFEKAIRNKPMFMNVNDRFSKDSDKYKQQITWFWDSMEKLFDINIKFNSTLDLQEEHFKSPPFLFFVHSRKSAGTSLVNLFHNNVQNVYLSIDQYKKAPQPFTNAVIETIQEFDTFIPAQKCEKCYVTLGRKPLERVISLYHWRIKRKQIPVKTTLKDYLTNKDARGIQRDDMYHGFYSWAQQWCGKAHECTRFTTNGKWILEQAKKNVEQYCGLIGVVERFNSFVAAGVKLFPKYFGNGYIFHSNSHKKNTPVSNDLSIAKKHYPSLLLQIDQEFYDWAEKRFERLYSVYDFELPVKPETMKAKTVFWQKGGGSPGWVGNGGYRPASFDSPNAPHKTPQLWASKKSSEQRHLCAPYKRFDKQPWYSEYVKRLELLKYIPTKRTKDYVCNRWWWPKPQNSYNSLPYREWSGVLRPKEHVAPECPFARHHKISKCSNSYKKLFDVLDRLRLIYFARSGTELGIVRQGTYLTSDGDLDIYVDMPQKMLFERLKKEITPPPKLSGSGIKAEVHWKVKGCPPIHMVYNDWMSEEMNMRAEYDDLCSCYIDSTKLLCHKNSEQRLFVQYGPSWNIPLNIKNLDMLWVASKDQVRKKLRALINKQTRIIDTLEGDDNGMALAQLNTELAFLDDTYYK